MSQASWDNQVVVVADVRDWPVDKTETAKAVALAIYRGTEKLMADGPVTVRLRRRFTLGIAHETRSERFPLDAKQWRAQRGIDSRSPFDPRRTPIWVTSPSIIWN
jgi:hypothetical protein